MDSNFCQSPLNQAHAHARAAEAYTKAGRFEQACKCHQQAVELLKQSLEIATFPSTRESIEIQIEHHQRQQHVVELKKLQYELQRKLLMQKELQLMMEEREMYHRQTKERNLQWAIYKTLREKRQQRRSGI